ncbi:MAG: M48 family metallopeptidase [Chloroflexota bacterium]
MWEQIRSNRIKSIVLVAFMGALLLAVGAFLGYYFIGSIEGGIIIALIVWFFMWLISYFQGDSILLSMSRAKKISRDDNPRLYNVVEEMKIASGLPKMPDIYIVDDPALNAFATGRDINHASVAITSGLLEKLNRDELQGVIAHEIGHIKNRDVLLMVILSVMMGSIVILSWYATRMMFFSSMTGGRSRRKSNSGGGSIQLILMVIGLILMILAPIFAQLIYLAVSRKREYLSDASSAQYTRYPDGLASALEKLATSDTHVKTANKATAPMYISNPFQKKALSAEALTSTHPPLADRIRILRAMSGASLADYNNAYRQVHKGSRNVIPASAITSAGSMGIRAASPEKEVMSTKERARETSNLMWRLADYKTINCDCGTKLKIPPEFRNQTIKCPHCGRVHSLEEAA